MTTDFDYSATNTDTATNISDGEYAQFRAWKDSRIREAAIAEGRAQASAERQAEDREADAAAVQKLASKGLNLRDCFGNSATARGRDALINISRNSFSTKSGAFTRLRRMAQQEGLVQ